MKLAAVLAAATFLVGCAGQQPADPGSTAPGVAPSDQPASPAEPNGADDAGDGASLPDPGKGLITDPAY